MNDKEFLDMRETYSMFCTDENYLEIAKRRYNEGLGIGQTGVVEIHIAITGVWTARVETNYGKGSLESFELVGQHTGSNSFIKGVKDAGIPVIDHRQKV